KGTELLLGSLLVAPLLRDPVGGDADGHRLHHEDEAAGSVAFAVDEVELLSGLLDRFESAADFSIGKTRHWALPSGYEVGSPVALLGSLTGISRGFDPPKNDPSMQYYPCLRHAQKSLY